MVYNRQWTKVFARFQFTLYISYKTAYHRLNIVKTLKTMPYTTYIN